MRGFLGFLFSLLFLFILAGCSGGVQGKPVPLPVPFAGALDNETRVVVADGFPLGGNPVGSLAIKNQAIQEATNFTVFDKNGNNVGTVQYGRLSSVAVSGTQTSFLMPACLFVDAGDEVCAQSMQFFEYPHQDPTIDICSLIPAGAVCADARLVKGAGSGAITSAQGSYVDSIGRRNIDHRYVWIISGQGENTRILNVLESSWLLHRI